MDLYLAICKSPLASSQFFGREIGSTACGRAGPLERGEPTSIGCDKLLAKLVDNLLDGSRRFRRPARGRLHDEAIAMVRGQVLQQGTGFVDAILLDVLPREKGLDIG